MYNARALLFLNRLGHLHYRFSGVVAVEEVSERPGRESGPFVLAGDIHELAGPEQTTFQLFLGWIGGC